jgi:RNA polymerase sigma-70 factor (ECF subfamily)
LSSAAHVTEVLLQWNKGQRAVKTGYFGLVYSELRRMAACRLLKEPKDQSLQATALVHEAYLGLIDQQRVNWENRSQFFKIAARLMRRILVDHARARKGSKRPNPSLKVSLRDLPLGAEFHNEDFRALNEALEHLEAIDSRQARIVEMRFIKGLSEDEIACALGVGVRTVKRDWRLARGSLYCTLRKESHGARAVGPS